MENQPNQPDSTIDKTLAAINAAAPPEGMEARIAARIAAQPSPVFSPWRDLFAGSSLAGAWWRGALTGAAIALFAISAALLLQHHSQTVRPQAAQNEGAGVHGTMPTPATPVAQTKPAANPCAGPNVLRVRSATVPQRTQPLSAINAPSHLAPVRPLTAQERALAELARTADPKMLVALAPETQAKVEAQEEENFTKFFAPPPAPPKPADDPSPTNTQENRSVPKEGEQI